LLAVSVNSAFARQTLKNVKSSKFQILTFHIWTIFLLNADIVAVTDVAFFAEATRNASRDANNSRSSWVVAGERTRRSAIQKFLELAGASFWAFFREDAISFGVLDVAGFADASVHANFRTDWISVLASFLTSWVSSALAELLVTLQTLICNGKAFECGRRGKNSQESEDD
jgi:hypothetical protein